MELSKNSLQVSTWCKEQLSNTNEEKSQIGIILKDLEEALNELDTKIEQGALMTLDLLMGISNPVRVDKLSAGRDNCERCRSVVALTTDPFDAEACATEMGARPLMVQNVEPDR